MKFVARPLEKTADISRGKVSLRTALKWALEVVLALGALYLVLGVVADQIAVRIPIEWEKRLKPTFSGWQTS